MRVCTLILMLLLLTGCVTSKNDNWLDYRVYDATIWPNARIEHAFWNIYFEKYTLHEYDCSNKCSKLISIMDKAGFVGDLIVLEVDYGEYKHAIVRTKIGEDYVYYDPTNGKSTKRLEELGKYVAEIPSNQVQFFKKLNISEWTF